MDKIKVLDLLLHSDVPGGNFLSEEKLTVAVLSISENFRSSGQMPRLPDDQIWTKMQFWSYKIILVYKLGCIF